MSKQLLPPHIKRYFWGDDLSQLSLESNGDYILQTLLEIGDQKAIQWVFTTIDKEIIIEQLPRLKLTPKSAHFWNIYLS